MSFGAIPTPDYEPKRLKEGKTMATKRETSQAGVLGSLQIFRGKLEANSADLAHLEVSRAKFGTMLGRIDDLSKEQGAMMARKQEASKEIQSLLVEAQRLGAGLRVMVKEHYGPRSEKLTEFGLQPFRGRKAKTPAPETPGAPAPPPPHPAAAKD
jgi:hypothetical protein